MGKKLSDYLPFYYGCEFIHVDDFHNDTTHKLNGYYIDRWNENCTLPLRPLYAISLDEMAILQIDSLDDLKGNLGDLLLKTTDFLMLLHWGFDLFGLIESGLAIDKTKLTVCKK